MASIPFSRGYASTSTPIQQHCDGGFKRSSKRFLNSPAKEIDVLSPIRRTTPFKHNLFDNLNDLEPYFLTLSKKQILIGVSRKLKFTELSNLIDVSNHQILDNDSGIESDINLSTSEDQSLLKKSTSFLTDENCNILNSHDTVNDHLSIHSSNYIISEIYTSDIEHIKSKDKLFESLDNRIDITADLNKNTQNAITNLDILTELNLRNCTAVLSLILSYLPDEDLQKASCVNKEWRNIVCSDTKLNTRRKDYIKEKKNLINGPKKENRFQSKSAKQRSQKPAFLRVINTGTVVVQQPLNFTQTVGKFDSFIQEAENLHNEEMLIKCPKCLYPSKAQSVHKFSCTRNLCQHVFCKDCLGPYLDNHFCSIPKLNATLPRITIGSKQSRKNLRRL